jgi:dCMP deaminase
MRKSWDVYYMDIAQQVATRATCPRKHVGAIVVKNNGIVATGYNGSIPGTAHCYSAGCMLIFDPNTNRESCVRTVHAEANAIVQAAKLGSGGVAGGTVYTTASPCWPCFKLIASAGITRIVFGELYRDDRIWSFAAEAGLELYYLAGVCACGHGHDHWTEKGKPGHGGEPVDECGLIGCGCTKFVKGLL